MKFCIDIDGVIGKKLKWTIGDSYLRAKKMFKTIEPNKKVIKKINELFEDNVIILFTSRLWHDYDVTVAWLDTHGVKYDQLIMAKPLCDVYVDDKNMSVEEFLNES